MRMLTYAMLLLVAGLAAWVRLAPHDPTRWHVDPADPAISPGAGRFLACAGGDIPAVPGGAATLARLDAAALATPRTWRLAGRVAQGRITWVTRSLLWGFPDYTTAALTPEGGVCIFARQRFGSGDMGVNQRRLRAWLAAL